MYKPLSKLWYLWIPALFMAFQAVIENTLSSHELALIHSEGGPHETLQFIVIFAAFIIALRTALSPQLVNRPWLRGWVVLAAACCFYVAGEEISWGQQVLHWTTPEYWDSINDQHETNLHNTSTWLDQKPRALLEIGVLVGGIIIPFLRRFKPSLVPARFSIIYPPDTMVMPALFCLGIKISDIIDKTMKNISIFHRGSEVMELYLFYFVLLYLIILRHRVLQDER